MFKETKECFVFLTGDKLGSSESIHDRAHSLVGCLRCAQVQGVLTERHKVEVATQTRWKYRVPA
jgi:hypothetical protein